MLLLVGSPAHAPPRDGERGKRVLATPANLGRRIFLEGWGREPDWRQSAPIASRCFHLAHEAGIQLCVLEGLDLLQSRHPPHATTIFKVPNVMQPSAGRCLQGDHLMGDVRSEPCGSAPAIVCLNSKY